MQQPVCLSVTQMLCSYFLILQQVYFSQHLDKFCLSSKKPLTGEVLTVAEMVAKGKKE